MSAHFSHSLSFSMTILADVFLCAKRRILFAALHSVDLMHNTCNGALPSVLYGPACAALLNPDMTRKIPSVMELLRDWSLTTQGDAS